MRKKFNEISKEDLEKYVWYECRIWNKIWKLVRWTIRFYMKTDKAQYESNNIKIKIWIKDLWKQEVIHCKTEAEATTICKMMHDNWLKRFTWVSYLKTNLYDLYKEKICYLPYNWSCNVLDYFKEKWYTIYNASDFIEEPISDFWQLSWPTNGNTEYHINIWVWKCLVQLDRINWSMYIDDIKVSHDYNSKKENDYNELSKLINEYYWPNWIITEKLSKVRDNNHKIFNNINKPTMTKLQEAQIKKFFTDKVTDETMTDLKQAKGIKNSIDELIEFLKWKAHTIRHYTDWLEISFENESIEWYNNNSNNLKAILKTIWENKTMKKIMELASEVSREEKEEEVDWEKLLDL